MSTTRSPVRTVKGTVTSIATSSIRKIGSTPTTAVFSPKDYVTPTMNQEEVLRVKQIFDVFDSDHSGTISPKEMQEAITRLNMEGEAQQILDIIREADQDGDMELNFREFLRIFGFSSSIHEEKTIDDLFAAFDEDNDGFIIYDDFIRMSQSINERYSEMELKEMVDAAGTKEAPGKVSKKDFIKILSKQYPLI